MIGTSAGPQPRPSDVPTAIKKDQDESHRDDLDDHVVPTATAFLGSAGPLLQQRPASK